MVSSLNCAKYDRDSCLEYLSPLDDVAVCINAKLAGVVPNLPNSHVQALWRV